MTPQRTKILLFPVCETEIFKFWDMLFKPFLSRRKQKRNGTKIISYFFVTCSWSLGKEYWLGTRKVTPKINIKYFFRDIWSVNNPIQTAAFLKHNVILYYTGPNFLTLKVATYLKRKLYVFLQRFYRYIRNVFRIQSNIWDGALCENS